MTVHDKKKSKGRKGHSIAEARTNLPNLVREAESGKTVELTRHGKPVAVLLGHFAYERLRAGLTRFSDAYAEFIQREDPHELDLDPDELFRDTRPLGPGRPVRW